MTTKEKILQAVNDLPDDASEEPDRGHGEANLERAKLEEANLENANLEMANLRMARLEGTNLKGANLKAAILIGAVLAAEKPSDMSANLTQSDLRGIQFTPRLKTSVL